MWKQNSSQSYWVTPLCVFSILLNVLSVRKNHSCIFNYNNYCLLILLFISYVLSFIVLLGEEIFSFV